MNVSEAIEQLHAILHGVGDVEVVDLKVVDNYFVLQGGQVFEAIQPEGCDHFVAALMEPIDDSDGEPPPLRLVKTDG